MRINNTSDKSDDNNDVEVALEDVIDPRGSRSTEDQIEREETLEGGLDPNELLVTLEVTSLNGEECAELYAHGEKFSFHAEKNVMRAELLARVSASALTMFPLEVDAHRTRFLDPKYGELRSITVVAKNEKPWRLPESVEDFDELLQELPTGFVRHAIYGLGFKWEYRLIPEAILELVGVTELVLQPGEGASAAVPKFTLGIDRFTKIRKSIDAISKRATTRSLKARRLAAYNGTLHAANPDRFEHRYPEIKPGEIYELVQMSGRASNRTAKDGLAAAKVVREDAQKIASEEPAKLLELKAIIEQVTLAQLIDEFESMLQKDLTEQKWQKFFEANPFVLGLAFPYPVILFQEQASVGGTTMRGKGESIVDFLMAQQFTGNLAIIEIKRPSTELVEAKPYRGDLYAPHRRLTESMAQVLDQRAQLLFHFAGKKSQDKALADAHVSSVTCIVIAGTLPTDPSQIRSLDLFRHSSKDVSVITFHELLEKLRELLRLMTARDPAMAPDERQFEPAPSGSDADEIPF